MKKKLTFLFIVLIATCINSYIKADARITIGHITLSIGQNESIQEFKKSEDFRLVNICNEYIDTYYPKTKFPISIYNFSDSLMENTMYSIEYNAWGGGAAILLLDSKEDKKSIEEIGIVITSNSNIVTILKLLDYGIQKEPDLKKKFNKIRNKIKKDKEKEKYNINTSEEYKENLIIYIQELKPILQNPPNTRITKFLGKLNKR